MAWPCLMEAWEASRLLGSGTPPRVGARAGLECRYIYNSVASLREACYLGLGLCYIYGGTVLNATNFQQSNSHDSNLATIVATSWPPPPRPPLQLLFHGIFGCGLSLLYCLGSSLLPCFHYEFASDFVYSSARSLVLGFFLLLRGRLTMVLRDSLGNQKDLPKSSWHRHSLQPSSKDCRGLFGNSIFIIVLSAMVANPLAGQWLGVQDSKVTGVRHHIRLATASARDEQHRFCLIVCTPNGDEYEEVYDDPGNVTRSCWQLTTRLRPSVNMPSVLLLLVTFH